jgi:hypothetical protein
MKKWNALRVIGATGALILIVFGTLGNFFRTVKFGLAKISRRD